MKMLGVKSILQPRNSTVFPQFAQHIITSTPSIPVKPPKINSSACFNALLLQTQGRNGVVVSAVKRQKRGSKSLMEFHDLDDDEDDDEEEGEFIPLSEMKEWFEKKPTGFGQGKEYDTSLEEKLLEELEQSRKAQLANIINLKNNPSLGNSKEKQVTKAAEPVRSGFRVRVGNLPKKRNVQRDLQLVFKGFPALVNISPAVSGNKKTRDPICKGFAFVDLGSVEAANRFVQTFSGKSITFGKIQKQITCEMLDPTKTSIPASPLTHKYTPGQRLPLVDLDSNLDLGSKEDSEVNNLCLETTEVAPSEESCVEDQQLSSATLEAVEEGIAHVNLSEVNDNENQKPATTNRTDSLQDYEKKRPATAFKSDLPGKQQQKPKKKKKQTVKGKFEKSPKLSIPGSTKRLRVKEKAVLEGVFSKYGSKPSPSLTKGR